MSQTQTKAPVAEGLRPPRVSSRGLVFLGLAMKRCSKCKKLKPESEFYKRPDSRDGLFGSCKKCSNKRTRERRAKHPDRCREYQQKWRAAHPNYHREYYSQNGTKEPYRLIMEKVLGRPLKPGQGGEHVQHHLGKVNADDVRLIRHLHKFAGMTLQAIGDLYGISQSNIHSIVTRHTWKNIGTKAEVCHEQR